MRPGTEELIDRIQPERVSRLGKQIAALDMLCQGQVWSPKVITNYLLNGVYLAHVLWAILCIECSGKAQKVIRVMLDRDQVVTRPRSRQNRSKF